MEENNQNKPTNKNVFEIPRKLVYFAIASVGISAAAICLSYNALNGVRFFDSPYTSKAYMCKEDSGCLEGVFEYIGIEKEENKVFNANIVDCFYDMKGKQIKGLYKKSCPDFSKKFR